MKRATQQLFAFAAVLGVAVGGGCGGGSTNSNPAPIPIAVSVTLSPATASVQGGQTQAFTASVANDSANKGVTWALSGAGCSGATCGTLSATSSASGVAITYTAPASVPNPASVTLTATSVADGTKTAAAVITITAAPPVPAIGVTLSQTTASVVANNGLVLSATVTNDSRSKGVTWSLSGMGCSGVSCGTIVPSVSPSGASVTYTAPPNVPNPPVVTLTATSLADPTKSAAAAITVVAPITISLSQTAVSVMVNVTTTSTATVGNDPLNKGVGWTLFGAGCAGAACGAIAVNQRVRRCGDLHGTRGSADARACDANGYICDGFDEAGCGRDHGNGDATSDRGGDLADDRQRQCGSYRELFGDGNE